MEGEEEGDYYTYRYSVTTRMTCIKMGSDDSHFNVSLIVRDKVTRQCPQTTTFEEKGEPKRRPSAYQPNALPLSQTGSLLLLSLLIAFIQRYSPLSSRLTEIACDST